MLRMLARTAAAGAHAYMTLALLLDGAPDHRSEPRSLSGFPPAPELKQTSSTMMAHDNAEVLHQPPSAQQLAPLALDLVRGMEGMLQMTQQQWRTFQTVVIEEIACLLAALRQQPGGGLVHQAAG
ncbi:hypothetical protein HaLaN_19710 [Haematococcus lacustris]|uniref:Uncharacterized protein n=1 Tax=Haematococcus lacustris TaxID=44745 RepID=A0A699ZVB7_HAELA|nr:hypothetical protein HaLaN_19710 [Haematococcus lacustris]